VIDIKNPKEMSVNMAMTPDIIESYSKRYPKLVGIRGWLVFFLVGLIVSVVVNFFSSFLGFTDQTMYTQTILSQYPSLPVLIRFENIFQIVIAITGVVLVVMMLQRHKATIRFATIYFTIILIYGLTVSVLGYVLFQSNTQVLNAAFKGGGQTRAILYSTVWLAYFMTSRRVKATFDGTRAAVIDKVVTSRVINDGTKISHGKFEKQLDRLEDLAIKLDKGCRDGKVADETVKKAEEYLEAVSEDIIDSRSVGDRAYIVYEVQALLLWIKHDEDESRELTKVASETKGDDALFTQTANMILRS